MTKAKANRLMEGTGQFIDTVLASGRVRVVNEAGDAILFYAKGFFEAARRAIERHRADLDAFEAYQKAGGRDKCGPNYSSFVKRTTAKQRREIEAWMRSN